MDSVERTSSGRRRTHRGLRHRRGSALVEGALVFTFIFVPMLLGLYTYGFNLVRMVQVNQVNRDAGHMFARSVDFTTDTVGQANRAIIYKIAPRLQTSGASGTAVMILSLVQKLDTYANCSCSNHDQVVFVQQITLGNSGLKSSIFGTPAADQNTGNVSNYLNVSSAVARNVGTYITLDGESAYISETYFSSSDLSIPGFPSPAGAYARAFF